MLVHAGAESVRNSKTQILPQNDKNFCRTFFQCWHIANVVVDVSASCSLLPTQIFCRVSTVAGMKAWIPPIKKTKTFIVFCCCTS